MSNYYDSQATQKPDALFGMLGQSYPISDFLLRLDLLGALAGERGQRVEAYVGRNWDSVFRGIPLDGALERACDEYFTAFRLGFSLLSRRKDFQSPVIVMRTLIIVTVLKRLADGDQDTPAPDLNRLKADVAGEIRARTAGARDVESITTEILSQYFSKTNSLLPSTVMILSQYSDQLAALFDTLCAKYPERSSRGRASGDAPARTEHDERREPRAQSRPAQPQSDEAGRLRFTPLRYAQTVCLLYRALRRCQQSGGAAEECVRAEWAEIYPGLSFTDQAYEELMRAVDGDPTLSSIRERFSIPLEEAVNRRLMRAYVVPLCVFRAIAGLPLYTKKKKAAAEAAVLFARFKGLSAGKETEDIERCLAGLTNDGGEVREPVSEVFRAQAETVTAMFEDALERYPKRKEAVRVSSLRYAQTVCLLYLALLEHQQNGTEFSDAVSKNWQTIHPGLPFTDRDYTELLRTVDSDRTLSAINKLFEFPLEEITNGRIVRRYVSSLCVHRVLSKMPHNSLKDKVTDEAAALFSRFSDLAVGLEMEDIDNYVSQFANGEGVVDERISALLWTHEETISKLFKDALEIVNSADSARKRFWWEEVISQKNQQLTDLQEQLGGQIDMIKANMIFSVIQSLTSPSYNYVLSRLYRFAYGFDTLPEAALRMHIKDLIQVFQLYGVMATGEDLIGENLDAAKTEGCEISELVLPDFPENEIVFPGWTVYGDVVTQPAGAKKEAPET